MGFRWFVEREAHILGIAGWVRNNADGSVEVLAMGRASSCWLEVAFARRDRARLAWMTSKKREAKPVAGLTTFRIEGAW